jgi:NAD(P)-dependent dehydrogenase (short-subunit alcohol dehydrogenase family)
MDASVGQLLSLDGKVALITGAATGIGEGIAELLAAAGAHVVIGDVDTTGAEQVAAELRAQGKRADAIYLDVTDEASARAAVASAVELGGRFDILVNNAGSYHESGSIVDQTTESWRRSIAVNFESVFLCSKPAAEHLVANGGGAIVSIASVDGYLPCLGTSYDAAKAAVIHFTRSLAVDLAPMGVRVNAVAPGVVPVPTLEKMRRGELPPVWQGATVETGLMGPLMQQRSRNLPIRRQGTVDDIARAVLFLCSDASSYVIGQTLVADGGWTLV